MRRLLPLLALALAFGCSPKEQDDALARTKELGATAAGHAQRALGAALDSAKRLDVSSGEEALRSGAARLEQATKELSGDKLKEAEIQLARLNAALDVQKVEREMEARVQAAMQAKENAEKTADQLREQLAAADKAYKGMEARLAEAQRVYEDAQTMLNDVSAR